jgi:hypothetical protein
MTEGSFAYADDTRFANRVNIFVACKSPAEFTAIATGLGQPLIWVV